MFYIAWLGNWRGSKPNFEGKKHFFCFILFG